MEQLYFRKLWTASALSLGVACASTTLEVPPETAANPEAGTMPVASATPALEDDFDPWAMEPASAGHEGHEGHQGHEAAPSSEGHQGHEAAPSSEGHEGHEAAPSSDGHEGHHHD